MKRIFDYRLVALTIIGRTEWCNVKSRSIYWEWIFETEVLDLWTNQDDYFGKKELYRELACWSVDTDASRFQVERRLHGTSHWEYVCDCTADVRVEDEPEEDQY